jgi:hypothetical protein
MDVVRKIMCHAYEGAPTADAKTNLILVHPLCKQSIIDTESYERFQRERMIVLLAAKYVHESVFSSSDILCDVCDEHSFSDVVDMWEDMFNPVMADVCYPFEYVRHAVLQDDCAVSFAPWVHVPTLERMVHAMDDVSNAKNVYATCNAIGQKLLRLRRFAGDTMYISAGSKCACKEIGLPQECRSFTCMATLLVWRLVVKRGPRVLDALDARRYCFYGDRE